MDEEDGTRVCTYEQVGGQRRHHKACEGLLLQVPHVAQPRQVVGVHQPHDEDDDGLDSGDGPGGDVEVGAVHLDGLVAPLEAGRQEPGQGQDHPPARREGTFIWGQGLLHSCLIKLMEIQLCAWPRLCACASVSASRVLLCKFECVSA